MIPFGAPAFTALSSKSFAVFIVDSFARGCGLRIIAFRVFRQIKILKIVVDVGFVVGIIPATTPNGSAIFWIPEDKSSSITPQVFTFL